MIKKQIKYVDFNGIERNEDFYFHLTPREATKLAAKYGAVNLEEYITNLVNSSDMAEIIDILEAFILGAYGKKSLDGKSFLKTPEDRLAFEYSEAYANLFEELMTNPDAMRKFVDGIGAKVQKVSTMPSVEFNTNEQQRM